MKLLLDEQLSSSIAKALRKRGHDVVAIVERAELTELRDPEVLAFASEQKRAVATKNVIDFRPLAAEAIRGGDGHWGLILISEQRRRPGTGSIVRGLAAILDANPKEAALRNQERWLPG